MFKTTVPAITYAPPPVIIDVAAPLNVSVEPAMEVN